MTASRLPGTVLLLVFSMVVSAQAERSPEERLLMASPETIAADPALRALMESTAKQAIEAHCAECHGADLSGQIGVPVLTDYDWLWGVSGYEMTTAEPVFAIMQTILYGIRSTDCPDEMKRYGGCPDTRYSQMPAYGEDLAFSEARINDLVDYVLNLAGREADAEAVARAETDWRFCVECHGEDGMGYQAFGGPDLSNDIWLYGGERGQIAEVIHAGRMGVCPAWHEVLDMTTVKALAVYIYDQSFGL